MFGHKGYFSPTTIIHATVTKYRSLGTVKEQKSMFLQFVSLKVQDQDPAAVWFHGGALNSTSSQEEESGALMQQKMGLKGTPWVRGFSPRGQQGSVF